MTVGVAEHRQRADAQRNHRLLLEAAAEAFAQLGSEASAEEIASRAGVAKGTLFRHFATKEHLIQAVYADRLAHIQAVVAELATQPQPGLATIAELMRRGAALIAADRSFFDAATCVTPLDGDVLVQKQALSREVDALLERAQASGEVRTDIVGGDIQMLILAATNTCARSEDLEPDLWQRYIALMIDSLRSGVTTPLTVAPPADAEPDLRPLPSRKAPALESTI
jgi:AcrR family transcriptional regulator